LVGGVGLLKSGDAGGLLDLCWFELNGNGEIAPGTVPGVLDEGNISPEVAERSEKCFREPVLIENTHGNACNFKTNPARGRGLGGQESEEISE
jgi:hypothetical protein